MPLTYSLAVLAVLLGDRNDAGFRFATLPDYEVLSVSFRLETVGNMDGFEQVPPDVFRMPLYNELR